MGKQWATRDHVKAFALLLDRDISTTVSSLSSGTPPVQVQPEAVGDAFSCRDQVWRKLVDFFLRQLAKAFWALVAHDLANCSSKKRFLCFSHHGRHPSGVWHKLDRTPASSQLHRSRDAEVRDDTKKAGGPAKIPRSCIATTNLGQVQREDPHTDYLQWVLRLHDSLQLERLSQLHSFWESCAGKSPRGDVELRNGRVLEESPIQKIHSKVEGRTGQYFSGSL